MLCYVFSFSLIFLLFLATDLDEIDEGEFMQRMSTSFVQFGMQDYK